MNETNFSVRLKDLRTANNLTQTAIGKAVGLSTQAINDIEHGRRATTLDKLIALADYFQVSLDYLTGRTDQRIPFPPEKVTVERPKCLPLPSFCDNQEAELHEIYVTMDAYRRGMLLERARILARPVRRPQSLVDE